MATKIIQSINVEIADGRKVVFTTERDKRCVDTYGESMSAIMDLAANSALTEVNINPVIESQNLYILTECEGVVVRLVPPGGNVLTSPNYTLVAGAPNFFGFKLTEVWMANTTDEDCKVVLASAGYGHLTSPIPTPEPPDGQHLWDRTCLIVLGNSESAVDSVPYELFRSSKYIIELSNDELSKYMAFEMLVSRAGNDVSDSLYGKIGDNLKAFAKFEKIAADVKLSIMNQESFALKVKVTKLL